MKKTDVFFVIHNYNTVPTHLLDYCVDHVLYDASDDPSVIERLAGWKRRAVRNTGHNITSYFRYFDESYESLPAFVALLKGNIIGRHVSKEFFDRVYDNHHYTFLYEDRTVRETVNRGVYFLAQENEYLEVNNSWYVDSRHPKRYFWEYNRLLRFVFKDPVLPEYCLFSPGACYIVTREQVRKRSRQFYVNLHKIMSYVEGSRFPSEAHMVERMLHTIFTACYPVNDWMNDEADFERALSEVAAESKASAAPVPGAISRAIRKTIRVLEGLQGRLGP